MGLMDKVASAAESAGKFMDKHIDGILLGAASAVAITAETASRRLDDREHTLLNTLGSTACRSLALATGAVVVVEVIEELS